MRPLRLFSCFLAAAVSLAASPRVAAAGSPQTVPLIASHKAAAPSNSPLATREVSNLPVVRGCTVDPDRELFIIDLSAVRDCYRGFWTPVCPVPIAPATRGAWTVGGLLPGLFGTTDPVKLSNLTKQWLGEWKVQKTINGDIVPARPDVQSKVIDPWQAASSGTTLDMTKAPFRLLAIVFRLDLRRGSGYSASSAGEARFVYNALDANGHDTAFTVIFEYGLDGATCASIQNWAQAIHGLGAIPFGPNYNAALQQITDRFTTIGASPGKPNGSAINQVRTDDVFLLTPWELREFKLQPGTAVPVGDPAKSRRAPGSWKTASGPAPLLQTTVAQTPAAQWNGQQLFADYVNANATAIAASNYTIPLSFNGQHFKGGAAPNDTISWDGPSPDCSSIANAQARHIASLNTCQGCHGGEAGVFFRQVALTGPGGGALPSGFLTGGGGGGFTITDICGLTHTFNDIERRRVDLCQLLQKSCTQIQEEQPANFVH
jgi:hypothetical protein